MALLKANEIIDNFKSINYTTASASAKTFLSRPANIGKCLLAAGVGYFMYKTIKIYLRRRQYRHIPGPKTRGILGFYFGHVVDMNEKIKYDKLFVDMLLEWCEEYGEVFKFQFMDEICICTTNKEAIKEALVIKNFPKVAEFQDMLSYPIGERFLGYGLLTEIDSKKWKDRRALFNPGFHRSVLMTFVKEFNSITNALLENLRQKADGKTVVSLFNEFNRATLDAIALVAFGIQTNSVMDPNSKINTYLANILRVNNEVFLNPILGIDPRRFKEVREFKEQIRYLRKMGRDRIIESIETFKDSESASSDILSSILKSAKESNLDLETMIDDFMTFFLAGQETTANALAFCFQELGKHPEIIKKAREEIDQVLGERSEITYQDVNDLKYCSAIFKETLRLFPPVPNVNRRANEEMEINGYKLPKGAFLVIATYINARQEKFFKDAYEFKPERFLKENESDSKVESYTYMPFSIGPRNCIGLNFAQLEGVIIIAKILKNFDFKLDPNQSHAIVQNLTLRPKDGTKCFLRIRS